MKSSFLFLLIVCVFVYSLYIIFYQLPFPEILLYRRFQIAILLVILACSFQAALMGILFNKYIRVQVSEQDIQVRKYGQIKQVKWSDIKMANILRFPPGERYIKLSDNKSNKMYVPLFIENEYDFINKAYIYCPKTSPLVIVLKSISKKSFQENHESK